MQNGTETINVFPKIKDIPFIEAAATRKALLRYCELDTLALVKVLERLEEVAAG